MSGYHSNSTRHRVAREAASLLYTSQEKEYKQAKLKAARTLGCRTLPSNAQVANELDKIAEETEGPSRREKLLQMRLEALQIMKALRRFNPKLIGSVWRGTAHRKSDIDIVVFASENVNIIKTLLYMKFKIEKTELQLAPKLGHREESFHIYIMLPSGNQAEIVVRNLERLGFREKCDIYGDTATGLNIIELERVLAVCAFEKFVP